jgi:gamma-glutamyltranspeptidase/glutathione hydrolase
MSSSDTVYLCAVDRLGNACSFIGSNYMGFGTGLVPRGWGFTLQNRGAGFCLERGHPNIVAPKKRPYHTIIPGMLTRESDGSLMGPFGVMGGFMQPQGHVQVVTALMDDGLDPQAALDRPRFCIEDGRAGGRVGLEVGIDGQTLRSLAHLGHPVYPVSGWARHLFGRGQVIQRRGDGFWWAGSDHRADGCAMMAMG